MKKEFWSHNVKIMKVVTSQHLILSLREEKAINSGTMQFYFQYHI